MRMIKRLLYIRLVDYALSFSSGGYEDVAPSFTERPEQCSVNIHGSVYDHTPNTQIIQYLYKKNLILKINEIEKLFYWLTNIKFNVPKLTGRPDSMQPDRKAILELIYIWPIHMKVVSSGSIRSS